MGRKRNPAYLARKKAKRKLKQEARRRQKRQAQLRKSRRNTLSKGYTEITEWTDLGGEA